MDRFWRVESTDRTHWLLGLVVTSLKVSFRKKSTLPIAYNATN
jgi:hypothetical protein